MLVGGTQTHSSISDALPTVNAVEAMAKTMVGLRRELRPRVPPHPLCPAGPTINIGVKALGGVGYGVVPGHAEFWTDIRTTPGMTSDALREDIEAALARVAPETPGATVTLDFSPDIGWVDATEVPADHPAVVAVQAAAAQILGEAPPLAAFHGGTDAWAFQSIAGFPRSPPSDLACCPWPTVPTSGSASPRWSRRWRCTPWPRSGFAVVLTSTRHNYPQCGAYVRTALPVFWAERPCTFRAVD